MGELASASPPSHLQQQLYSVRRSFMTCIFTCWVNSATLVPLQIAVEKKKKAPSVAFQLLIDSKKLVGSLRS